MFKIRPATPADGAAVVTLWARAVDATHDFLTPEDRAAIGAEVESFLPQAPLTLVVDDTDAPAAFSFVHDGQLEALFVDPDHHGHGLGRMLIAKALTEHPGLGTDVNAQNPGALGFYLHLGFVETGRSDLDGQGRPYPLIHLKHQG